MDKALTITQWLVAASFPLTMAYMALSDIRTLHIPNWASVFVASAFLPAALLGGMEPAALAQHYGTGLALLIGGALLFWRGLIGGGGAKMLAAGGVWFGAGGLAAYLFLVALIGGALAIAVLVMGKLSAPKPAWLVGNAAQRRVVPYGVAIGLAAIILFSRNPCPPEPPGKHKKEGAAPGARVPKSIVHRGEGKAPPASASGHFWAHLAETAANTLTVSSSLVFWFQIMMPRPSMIAIIAR